MAPDVRPGDVPARLAVLQDPYVLAALSGASVLVLAATYPLWGAVWSVVCPLRALTGIPCPTCFGTRAMLAVMAGHWGDAIRLNPLVALAAISLFLWVPAAVVIVVAGLPRPRFSAAARTRSAWAAVALALLNWIYLIVVYFPA